MTETTSMRPWDWRDRLTQYALLMRINKPIGVLLLMWPTLWALWMAAGGVPDWGVLVVFVLGVELMRAAGCIINDFADRRIDPLVARTRARPLATGRVSVTEALTLFVVLCLVSFALVLTMNRLTVLLAIPGLLLAACYPFSKRYTHFPQAILGMAFGWGIPMAFAAQTAAVPPLAWLLFLANIFWSMAYDTFYAMADRPDDLKIGVKSTAVLFGDWDRAITAVLQVLVLACLWLAGRVAGLGAIYGLGLLAALAISAYEQYLIRERDPQACFRAFLNNTWFGGAVFAGIFLDYWLR